MTPVRHVVLVGPMGVGKTTVGTLVAATLGRPLVDSDRVLVAEGAVAADIARDDGVPALHRRECSQLLAALGERVPAVIAAAASIVEAPACRAALGPHLVAWLRADPAVLAVRMDEGTHRRDLGPDPVEAVRSLAARRDPLYAAAADVVVDLDAVSPHDASAAVVDALRRAQRAGEPPADG